MKFHLLIGCLLLFVIHLNAQESPNLNTTSPISTNAIAAGKVINIPVNYFTGIPNISIPIHHYSRNGIQNDVSLDYFAGGVKVDEKAGNVGLNWQLSTGGAVIRNLRSLPDDCPGRGFLYTPEVKPGNVVGRGATRFSVENYAKDSIDSEQDVFQFKAGEHAGSFIIGKNGKIITIPQQNIKIRWYTGNIPGVRLSSITAFTIIVEDGTRYLFSIPEITTRTRLTQYDTIKPYVSAWYLKSIISPYAEDTINFTYKNVIVSSNIKLPTSKFDRSGETTVTYNNNDYVTINTQYLTRVSFPYNLHLNFIYDSTQRRDIPGEYALTKIELRDSVLRTGYKMEYRYFSNKGIVYPYNSTDTGISKLMLYQIYTYTQFQTLSPYEFTYSPLKVPKVNDTGQDHWGYFNNKANVDLVPALGALTGADREPDSNYVQSGTLTAIKYPNGAKTSFEYEANDKKFYYYQQSQSVMTGPAPDYPQFASIVVSKFPGNSATIRVTVATRPHCPTTFDFMRIPALLDEFKTDGSSGGTYKTYTLTSNNYQLLCAPINNCSTQTIPECTVSWTNDVQDSSYALTGGIRIKRIITQDSPNQGAPMIREFKYRNQDNSSSGFAIFKPKYDYPFSIFNRNGSGLNKDYTVRVSSPMNSLDYIWGTSTGYSRVEEIIPGNGKMVYEFTTYKDLNYFPLPPQFPFATKTYPFWEIGLPKKITAIDQFNTAKKISEKKYRFSVTTTTDTSYKSIKLLAASQVYSSAAGYLSTGYAADTYYPITGLTVLDSSTEKDISGADTLLNTSTYMYDSLYNLVSVKNRVSTDLQKYYQTNIYYPYNYTVTGALKQMKDSGIIIPIAVEKWIKTPTEESLQDANITGVSFVNGTQIRPQYSYKLQTADPIPLSTIGSFNGAILNRNVSWFVLQTTTNKYGTSQWLTSTIYYNDKGRVIQTIGDNISGGTDIVSKLYNFNGKLLSSYHRHKNKRSSLTPQTTILSLINYDHGGRMLSISKQINDDGNTKVITRFRYDELSQLKSKSLSTLDSLEYDNSIQGWLKAINKGYTVNGESDGKNHHFGEQLYYDSIYTPQFNGNISGLRWRGASDNAYRSYGFGYDAANRLLKADFTQYDGGWNTSAGIDFSMKVGDGINPDSAYDANGNILHTDQKGFKPGGSVAVDNLRYTYLPNSNKLQGVTDQANDPSSMMGDFKETNGTGNNDYSYDGNGNFTKDENKGITSISYNYLNLPEFIKVVGKGTIRYVYDADGNKLRKIVIDSTVSPARTITDDYINGFVYHNDTLRFFSHEEGRIRMVYKTNTPPLRVYDYFIKDHLDNIRSVLTEQTDQARYAATMESSSSTTENILFSNIDNTRAALPAGYPADNTTNPNAYVARLNAVNGQKIGPSLVLRIMAGDTIQLGTKAFYKSVNAKIANTTPENMLSALLLAFSGVGISDGGHMGTGINSPIAGNFTSSDYNTLKQKDPDENLTDKPKAYLNYALFDDRFNMVAENSGVKQVQGNPDELQTLATDRIVIRKTGFIYIYTSNESGEDVFFDNLVVTQNSGPLLAETHYYPFGLVMDGISSRALVRLENQYLYQGKELQSGEFTNGSGLEWYDFGARYYDAQLGRWFSVDPVGQDFSPYMAMGNRPTMVRDPDGRFWHIVIGAAIGGAFNLWTQYRNGNVHSFGSGLAAFGIGALAGGAAAATGGAVAGVLSGVGAGAGLAGSVTLGTGGFVTGAGVTAAGAATGGFVEGTANALVFDGATPLDAFGRGAHEGIMGMGFGVVTGGLTNGIFSTLNGRNFWDGSLTRIDLQPIPTATAPPLQLDDAADDLEYPSSFIDSRNNPNYTPNNYRQQFKEYTNTNPPSSVNAHHNIPQVLRSDMKTFDINIDHPKNLSWWPSPDHQQMSRAFQEDWKLFFLKTINPTRQQIIDKMLELKIKYNLK